MNATLIPIQPSKRPLRRLAAGAFHRPSREIQPATTPLSPQTPSLPVPDPANDATREKQIPFRKAGFKDAEVSVVSREAKAPHFQTVLATARK